MTEEEGWDDCVPNLAKAEADHTNPAQIINELVGKEITAAS